MYAKIITDIAHQDVDRIYTYGVPEKMEENIVPGMRVIEIGRASCRERV